MCMTHITSHISRQLHSHRVMANCKLAPEASSRRGMNVCESGLRVAGCAGSWP